jgi:hypothetical protein
LNLRDTTAEQQRFILQAIESQRALLATMRQGREAGAAWQLCLQLAEQAKNLEVARIAKTQIRLYDSLLAQAAEGVSEAQADIEATAELTKDAVEGFYQTRTDFKIFGDRVDDIDLPNADAQRASIAGSLSNTLDRAFLPAERAREFIAQLQAAPV